MKKRDGREIPRETMEHLRFQAIKLWKRGKDVKDISEFFGVTVDAVYKWIKKYEHSGLTSLKRKKAPGAKPKLSERQIKQLVKLLKKPANTYGFSTPLWDCKKIHTFIRNKFHVNLDFTNIWRLLRKMGLTYQVPERSALEKDVKEVRRWLREEWPKIQEHRRRWQAMLYFLDESGISLRPVMGKTWSPKGKTPIVKVTGKKGCIVVTSAISPSGRMVFRLEKDTIHGKEHIDFLKQIQRNHPNRKIIVIEDNARPHISKVVDEFADSQKKKFAIYRIPSYAPELNPAEKIWRYLKYTKLKAHQVMSMKEMHPAVRNNMISIREKRGIVRSFFLNSILY